jgi:hypothetical protein
LDAFASGSQGGVTADALGANGTIMANTAALVAPTAQLFLNLTKDPLLIFAAPVVRP